MSRKNDVANYFKAKRKEKTYKGEWYTINSILGNDWARYFVLLGGREAGKSYSVMKWAVERKIKLQSKCKFYWLRLTDKQTQKLLTNNANDLIDPDIRRKYNINTFTNGDVVYQYDKIERMIEHADGSVEIKIIKENIREFCRVLSCSTMYNTKGVGIFDNEYDGEYVLVLDEMNRESGEKNNFDIVYNFTNLVENLVRSTKTKIRIFMIGNTLDEASDLLTAFNFLPDTFGRYKLKRKRCVVDYIKPNEAYLKRRKGTVANDLMPEASTFTNEVQIDRSLLVSKRMATRTVGIIKFGKTKDKWFTIWNDNIITKYNGNNSPAIAMIRYLDELFHPDLQKSVINMFDARAYKFTTLADFKRFQKELKLIKTK